GSARAERGHGAIHETRVDLRQLRVAEAEAIRDAGAHVFEEHVAGAHELLDDGDAIGRLEIQGDGLLAAVPRVEAGQLAERLAFERLDLDDGRTEVGEHHPGVRAGDVARAIDHANAFERRHLDSRAPGLTPARSGAGLSSLTPARSGAGLSSLTPARSGAARRSLMPWPCAWSARGGSRRRRTG